jgi:hypothetical protein
MDKAPTIKLQYIRDKNNVTKSLKVNTFHYVFLMPHFPKQWRWTITNKDSQHCASSWKQHSNGNTKDINDFTKP